MFDFIVRIVVRKAIITSVVISFAGCLSDWGFGNGDVDLKKATWLVAEQVPLILDKGGVPGGTSNPSTPVNGLFKYAPGTKVNVQSLGGAIDPTGTTIVNDFDGDGILNVNETTTNVWVADYPVIESVIAPPVTMKIAVKVSTSGSSTEIYNEIDSADFESAKTEGSEKIHKSELNLKTVQYQDQYSESNELKRSAEVKFDLSVEAKAATVQVGSNYGYGHKSSWEAANSLSTTTTKWSDRPFKNNLDSDALNLKSNSSSENARKFRSEKSTKVDQNSEIASDAGYVRAALYIKNNSINMPVKLKNILCSLMFEAPTGELIPITSFRLRNQDYSLFEIEVYGGTEFGPYVIEVDHLNRAEVEKAIASGYNPKIFIVNYDMTHVKDSNYQSSLLNFSGDNLKVIEENSKGRTALVKVLGPNVREMYRVSAFETDDENANPCITKTATQMSPGISLKKALERIACSGTEIVFQDYVIDFSEIAPTLGESKLHLKGIKSIGGVATSIPCDMITATGSDGVSRTACVQKRMEFWTEDEKLQSGVWGVFSKGKYYAPTTYYLDGPQNNPLKRLFDPTSTLPAFMVQGIDSKIWAGDTYDIVYISYKDLAKNRQEFGTNPLETEAQYNLNTSWDLGDLGEHPYYPNNRSLFLGDAGFGEKVQLQLKLDSTKYLTPSFGAAQNTGIFQYFNDFSYNNSIVTADRFDLDQAMDFEISMGFGGTRTDWMHVVRDIGTVVDDYKMKSCGRTLNFTAQTFFLCLELPKKYPYVSDDVSLIKLYIRPSLNSAYRRTIWPLPYSEVRKVQSTLFAPTAVGDTSLLVSVANLITDGGSLFQTGDVLRIYGHSSAYTVASISDQLCEPTTGNTAMCKRIYLTSPISAVLSKTSSVYVSAALTSSNVRVAVENSFFSDWNTQYESIPTSQWETSKNLPLLTSGSIGCSTNPFHPSCLGFSANYIPVNWLGAYNYGVAHWNSWTDGAGFLNFLSGGLPNLMANTGRSFRVEANATDIVMNSSAPAPSVEPSAVVNQSGQTLTVWKNGTNLIAKAYNVKTGSVSSAYATLNSMALSGKYVIKASASGEIILIYEATTTTANDTIMVHRITIGPDNTVTSMTGNTVVSNRGLLAATPSYIDIANAGTYSLVVWNNSVTSGTNTVHTLKAKVVVVAGNGQAVPVTGTDVSNILLTNWTIATNSFPKLMVVAEAFSNTKVVIAYAQLVGTSTYGLSIISCDNLIDPALLGTVPVFNTAKVVIAINTTGTVNSLFVGGTQTGSPAYRGYVTWLDGTGAINGRGLDLDNAGTLLGSNTVISDITGGTNANLRFTLSQIYNYALATYMKANRIYVRAIKLEDGTLYGNALAMDSVTTASNRKPGSTIITFVNNGTSIPKFFTTWEHTDSTTSQKSIRGRIGNFQDLTKPEGLSELFISKTNDGDQTGPAVTEFRWTDSGSINQTKIVSAWLSTNGSKVDIKAFPFDIRNPSNLPYGMNNFFIAPMIERDYTLKAKISY